MNSLTTWTGLAVLMGLWGPQAAGAARPWTGVVTAVVDGDTVWVKRNASSPGTRTERAVDIRIEGIDAPEICQPYGPEARQALSRRILNQTVKVSAHRTDTYGRTLARLSLADEDVGDWMVRHGHAWSYHYRRQAGPYASQESVASGARRGLFADPAAMQPREFRKRHGSCHA